MEFVSWDDDIPNVWKAIKNVPNHQPVFVGIIRWMEENPAPADRWFITVFLGVQPSKVVHDFFHSQYAYIEYIICVCQGIMEYIDMLVKDNPYQNHICIH